MIKYVCSSCCNGYLPRGSEIHNDKLGFGGFKQSRVLVHVLDEFHVDKSLLAGLRVTTMGDSRCRGVGL